MSDSEHRTNRFWQEHFSLVVTAGLFSIFVAKLVAVSHSDVTTAAVIIQRTGPAQVLFGIATRIGLSVAAAAAAIGLVRLAIEKTEQTSTLSAAAFIVGSAVFVGILVPVISAATYFASCVVAYNVLHGWRPKRLVFGKASRAQRLDRLSAVSVFLAWLIVVFSVASDDMWLPSERLQLDDGTAKVGYILDEDDQSLVLLRQDDRRAERVATDAVEARTYCRPPGEWAWVTRSVYSHVQRKKANYPACASKPSEGPSRRSGKSTD